MLPRWFQQSEGSVEVEELRSTSGQVGGMRLFVVVTHRTLELGVPVARRPRTGARIEVVPISPAYDGETIGPEGSFAWALEQSVRLLSRRAAESVGLDEGWKVGPVQGDRGVGHPASATQGQNE